MIGNPNCGKTAFFNASCGGHERTGNYAGVTVSSVEGWTTVGNHLVRVLDLPGTYSLKAFSPEEAYVANELAKGEIDVIINVLDVNNLERNLLLTLQLPVGVSLWQSARTGLLSALSKGARQHPRFQTDAPDENLGAGAPLATALDGHRRQFARLRALHGLHTQHGDARRAGVGHFIRHRQHIHPAALVPLPLPDGHTAGTL